MKSATEMKCPEVVVMSGQ